jgi:FtsH-binding integral membrane protein
VKALPHPSNGRRIWLATSCAAALIAFAGFAPTYYLKTWFGTPALTPLLHVHAILFSTWLVVFGAQATLISARRFDLHRKLGAAALLLIAAMLTVGTLAAIESARKGLTGAGFDPLQFLLLPLGTLALFAALAAAGLWLRRDAASHKRLMTLATISLLTPAIARFGFVGHRPQVALGLTLLVALACIAYDWRTRGRLYPAWVWGLAAIVISVPARLLLARTEAWHHVAARLVR